MIYARNTHFAGTNIDVPVAEGYSHNIGITQAMLDNLHNNNIIFEALIRNDFAEAKAENSPRSFTESQIEQILEASTGGFLQKLIDFVKKIWEKIKGLFKSFWDTIRATLTRDNKELVNKFKSKVINKDLSKMKYKWREATGKQIDLDKLNNYRETTKSTAISIQTLYSGTIEQIEKARDSKNEDYKEELLGKLIGTSSVSMADFEKEAFDCMYESEDTEEGLSSSRLSYILEVLSTSSKTLKNIKDGETETNKQFKKELDALDKFRNTVNKDIPSDSKDKKEHSYGDQKYQTTDNDSRQKLSLAISTVHQDINIYQAVLNKAIGTVFNMAKFDIKQSRKVFIAAAGFNPKAVKESNMLFEHYSDQSDHEFDTMVEGVGY